MDFSSEKTLKSLVLRHRSVAVLIRRGHLDDARLLLFRSIEDIVALAERFEKPQLVEGLKNQIQLLEKPIAPGSLAQIDIHRLSSVNTLCLQHSLALAALTIPASPATTKITLILTASLVGICIAVWAIFAFIESQKLKTAHKDLTFLAQIAYIAKIKTSRTLVEITGNNCSECSCRGKMDLRDLPVGQHCQGNWVNALAAIWQAASGESPFSVQGGIILEKRLLRDPWGSPFALDENTNMIRSAGP